MYRDLYLGLLQNFYAIEFLLSKKYGMLQQVLGNYLYLLFILIIF